MLPVVEYHKAKALQILFEGGGLACVELPRDASTLDDFERAAVEGRLKRLDSPVWGFTNGTVWCATRVLNASDESTSLHLEFSYGFYDQIVFYQRDEISGDLVERLKMGDRKPFHERPIRVPGFVFPFELNRGQATEIVVSMTALELMATPAILITPQRNSELKRNWSIIGGAVYGGSCLLAIFHVILFLFTRNYSYLIFSGFVLAHAAFTLSFRGIGFELFWPNSVEWHHRSIPFFNAVTQLFWLLLTTHYLSNSSVPKRLTQFGKWLGTILVLMLAYPFLEPGVGPFIAMSLLSLVTYCWIVAVVIFAWRSSRGAKFYALSFGLTLTFTMLDSLRIFKVFDYVFVYSESARFLADVLYFVWAHPTEIGVLFAELLLAAGLADQINVLRTDRERLRKEALDAALVSQEKLKSEVERQTLELKESRDRLLKIDEEKTAFFRMVSHELRTPLTLLQLPLERLEDEMGENPSLDMARRNAMRLQRLVNQLLDLQKSEVGRREEPLIRIEVHPFLATAGLYFAEAALAKGVHFELRRDGAAIDPSEDDGEPLYMHADIDGLEKIVFNYLANALKFTDAGGTIALGYRSLESGNIRIEVSDTGVGISQEDIKRLFSAFTQLDDSAARKVEGTGLGLALCKQLAEYMGGQVGVSSAVGEGSTFYLEVPAIEVTTEVAALEWAPREWLMAEHQQRLGELRSEDGFGVSAVDSGGKRVLVVDDLPDMRSLLGALLKENGYTIVEAGDGQEALALASRQPLDLMITDWMMPEMSGPELIASIRELPEKQGLPIILLTANADERARIEGVDTGADAFLSKPFQNRELLATVRNLLSLKVREGELEGLVVELRQTQEQLVAQSRMATLGELASGLAHEIRNPMNLAQGGVEEITEALKEPERDKAFDQQIEGLVSLIQRGIDRIESVIGRLHRLSQVRKSKVGGSSDLAAVVEDLRSFLNLSEAGRGAQVELNIPEGIEVGLDSGALNQVLLNLSLNAIQAGGKDVTLSLTYEPHAQEDLVGMLRVTDNGPGIPDEVGERIFEPFYTGRAEGTGLGLPLCRTIIREAGGRLWLDSDYAGGASFCIELPRPTEDDSLKVQAVAPETSSDA